MAILKNYDFNVRKALDSKALETTNWIKRTNVLFFECAATVCCFHEERGSKGLKLIWFNE